MCFGSIWGASEKWKLNAWPSVPLPGFDHDRAGRTGSETRYGLAHDIY